MTALIFWYEPHIRRNDAPSHRSKRGIIFGEDFYCGRYAPDRRN